MKDSRLRSLLEKKVEEFNTMEFIETDPVIIPHSFRRKEDIEIAGFLAATIAWGQRKTIIRNAERMMDLMEREPYEFVMRHSEADLDRFDGFVHRTFNPIDLKHFVRSLRNIYLHHGGLENAFMNGSEMSERISGFKKLFFSIDHELRTTKHVADPLKGSSAKRINMFLRWMVRNDTSDVDFGLWKYIKPSELYVPLDVHTGNVARELGLLKRKQNDWKAVEELTSNLRKFDAQDPVKYDFALFGMGVNSEQTTT